MNKLKVLMVDDESRMRKLVNDFLSRKIMKSLKPVMVKKQLINFMRIKILH